ncbi:PEP-CTERM sorting domain-containing protein [Microcystis flos-aquae]|uniref:PEP-CTERM sorting domain-containing protein n=1 Tax=Microcystis flos-aquae TaxID=109615 RepID=UPI001F5529BA|nr:PEP-CTERM sorting domain-containing protein [Microcystis flos-aquae]
MNNFKKIAVVSTGFLVLVLSGQSAASAASATGSSGGIGGRDSGSNQWIWSTPTAADTIKWTAGPNQADGKIFPKISSAEQKFFIPILGNPSGLTFAGINYTNSGPRGSVTQSVGSGNSYTAPAATYGTNYYAQWTVVADGTLGPTPPVNWASQTTGNDPWNLTSAQLTDIGITGTKADFWIPVGLVSGDYSKSGGIGLKASYTTASGTINLIDIAIDVNQVNVTSDSLSGLSFYLLNSINEDPIENPANLITLSSIKSILENDVLSDRKLDNPLYLGIVLSGIAVPTIDLGNGSVAIVDVSAQANDGAAIPEPSSTIGLLALGIFGAGATLKRKLKPSKSSEKETTKVS